MKKFFKRVAQWILIITISFLISSAVRTWLVETTIVPTGSMLPTIQLNDRLIIDKMLFKYTPLKRGDVVVFHAPPAAEETEYLVKRIVGLPGEKLAVHDGKVWVNQTALDEKYILEPPDYTYGPVTIPNHSYFVLGDNRTHSKDSHLWGFLPQENIYGRVIVRYWPISHFGPLAGT